MKICTQTDVLMKYYPDEVIFQMLKDAGFDAVDYSFFTVYQQPRWDKDHYKEEAQRLRKAAEEVGIPILQAHAPFSFNWKALKEENDIIPIIARCIEAAGIMGCEEIVVHPQHHPEHFTGKTYWEDPEAVFALNMDYYAAFKPICEQYGIKVCIENMWKHHPLRKCIDHDACSRPAEFNRYLDTLNADGKNHFGGCLDLGHTVLVGEDPVQMIQTIGGSRITTLHIHDNGYDADDHTLPGLGRMPMTAIFKALKEVGYQGKFTLEADNFIKRQDPALFPVSLKYMVAVARHYARIME